MRDGQRLLEDNDQHDNRHEKQDPAHKGRPEKVEKTFHRSTHRVATAAKLLPRRGSLMFRSYYEANRPYRQLGTSGDHNGERGRDPSAGGHRNQNERFLSHIQVFRGRWVKPNLSWKAWSSLKVYGGFDSIRVAFIGLISRAGARR